MKKRRMMSLTKRLWCALAGAVLALALAACKSSDTTPPTSSGFPEVTLRAKKANEVKVVAQEFFRDRGYVERDSRHVYEMVFDKPTKGERSPKALRVRLRLHEQSDNTWRLVGTPMGVESWRSDLETELVLPQGSSQIQAFLVEIKNRVEAGR
jgi:hypothetical protein